MFARKVSRLVAFPAIFSISAMTLSTAESSKILTSIKLSPVIKGAVAGAPIEAGSLWSNQPVMIHVVRRPG